ncbi:MULTISPECIES: hypothetical protein [Calothrix]|uniref:Uncharacterized protein n=2 Tax=Calothrix TaxID=1186 RepID=A0ABR8AI38_9CYAN|nr:MULTISPECIES: hypothetical protein [Calothrix]MBD2198968.1 hypothetical protein [Calothrix parietina FACHB-288]MBD2227670.1 hypothetical protein [Calothrix anomala FACHB-343]
MKPVALTRETRDCAGSPMPYALCPIPQVGGQKFISPLAELIFPADFL